LEQEHWERKYHLALERMERDEQQFRALEERLRRLAFRLGVLARGGGPELDALLERVAVAARGASVAEELDPLLDALGDAIARLDDHPPAAVPVPVEVAPVADIRRALWPEALRQVLLRIVLNPALDDGALGLRAALTEPCDDRDMPRLADEVARLINRQRELLRADIGKLHDLLREVSGRLDEMTRYLVTELEDQTAGAVDSLQLDATVRKEIQLLGEQTRDANDLALLQHQVHSRLEMIDTHFKEFREREEERQTAYHDRAERMRHRVEELESETTVLQDSLRREHELALTDPLTGMPNRLAYERRIDAEWQLWAEAGQPLCLAAFDIDHFKAINDGYGHVAGDAVLRIVGQALLGDAREDLFVARYGGEEFVAIFTGMPLGEAMQVAARMCRTVEALAFHASRRPVKVTMSGGVTQFAGADTPASVFERADRALYAAKAAGRNRCEAG
jgi:diguanylate cyclase